MSEQPESGVHRGKFSGKISFLGEKSVFVELLVSCLYIKDLKPSHTKRNPFSFV